MADIVPYHSSGASSRAHYALVRKVESASSTVEAERALLEEVHAIRARFAARALSLGKCKECLIILLYCANTSGRGSITPGRLAFGLPAAVNLAEAGSNVSEKRIGYLFCNEIMPRDHDMQLMLVNTLRKDLESREVPRIALALQNLISSPSMDVIPAVRTRLLDLMAHPSSIGQLREERVFEICASTLHSMTSRDGKERRDTRVPHDGALKRALLRTMSTLLTTDALKSARSDEVRGVLPDVRTTLQDAAAGSSKALTLEAFRLLSHIPTTLLATFLATPPESPPLHPLHTIKNLLSSREPSDHYVFLSCLRCLNPILWTGGNVQLQRPPPSDDDPFTGLEDTVVKVPDVPAALDQWEVEKVMTFLQSDDPSIRVLTLRILLRVDRNIVDGYFTQSLTASRSLPVNVALFAKREEAVLRLLEVARAMSFEPEEDGGACAGKIVVILDAVERPENDSSGSTETVMPRVLEDVLGRIREDSQQFQRDFIATFASSFVSNDSQSVILHGTEDSFSSYEDSLEEQPPASPNPKSHGGTLSLLFVALTCEYAHLLGNASIHGILRSLIALLDRCSSVFRHERIDGVDDVDESAGAMRETVVLAMMRLLVLCEPCQVPRDEILASVGRLEDEQRNGRNGSWLIVKRRSQLREYLEDTGKLSRLIPVHQAISLPEFALLLDGTSPSQRTKSPSQRSPSPSAISSIGDDSRSHASRSMSASKLRYTAYAPPTSPPPMRRGLHRTQTAGSTSSVSGTRSVRSDSIGASLSVSGGVHDEDEDGLARTVTAGELALAGGSDGFSTKGALKGFVHEDGSGEREARTPRSTTSRPRVHKVDELTRSADLISLDSPFLSEPEHFEMHKIEHPVPVPAPPTLTAQAVHQSPFSPGSALDGSVADSRESGNAGQRLSFEEAWNALDKTTGGVNSRGWCEAPMEEVVLRLQGLGFHMDVIPTDMAPFIGELKVLVGATTLESERRMDGGHGGAIMESVSASDLGYAAIRLKESEDEGCLWRMRCVNAELQILVSHALSDDAS
ncbi:ARM repeat-containing protein [Rickenella mellea]|uniref:ARM repeat-containing protein n=1 Tax=Rickenella mellea TaxID=50990 RepID=A0A4Y7Q1J7_9AGAM|nr:ARM repeat-containing protein [Rickenella mellea]